MITSAGAVHLRHQPAGEAGVMALGGRCEDDFDLCAELAGSQGLDHLIVSASVENAGLVIERSKVPEANGRSSGWKVMASHDDQRHEFSHFRKRLEHGRGDAREAFVRISKNEPGDFHLIKFGGVVGSRSETQSDGSDKKQVTGKELKVSLNGLRHVRVIVVAERRFPEQ